MTDSATPEPAADDPPTVGFAMLMVGVESAVASAAAEIAMLALAVQQGLARQPATPPAAQPGNPTKPPSTAPEEVQVAPARDAAAQPTPLSPAATVARPQPDAPMPQSAATSASAVAIAPPAPPRAGSVLPQPAELPASVASVAPGPLPSSRPVESAQPIGDVIPPPPTSLAPSAPISFAASNPESQKLPPLAPPASSAPSFPGAPIAQVAPPAQVLPASFTGAPTRAPVDAPQQQRSLAPPTVAVGQQPTTAARREPASDGVVPSPPARHREGNQGAQPHGDILLDGTRVGQWLSDMMARGAGGPAMGTTGFDARMGPRWPGALQGR